MNNIDESEESTKITKISNVIQSLIDIDDEQIIFDTIKHFKIKEIFELSIKTNDVKFIKKIIDIILYHGHNRKIMHYLLNINDVNLINILLDHCTKTNLK